MKWIGLTVVALSLGAPPAAPDYALEDNWAALPSKEDAADIVPDGAGLSNEQGTADVDVFYIHPTTYYRSYSGNADVKDEKLNDFTDSQPITRQATVYNGSARVFAPRYRQASLHNFFKRDDSKSRKAFDLAYSDVKRAFEFYLEHYNQGRPVIIAGHSQGSMHGKRLVKEFFDGTSLQSHLVAAYLIGYNIPKDEFAFLPVCDDPSQTGCVISFVTYGWDADPKYQDYSNAICVNPLSWKKDGKRMSRDHHLGGIPRTFDRADPKMIGCQCTNNILWITKPKERGYIMMGGKNYHLVDYNLFYMDIRMNVADRVAAYLKGQ